MTTGEYLKDIRMRSGFSIRDVVERSNSYLDKTTISRIERNERGISFRAAFIFSRIYQVDMIVIAEKTFEDETKLNDIHSSPVSDEQSLIEMYRLLPRDRKRILLNIVLGLVESYDAGARKKARKKVCEALKSAQNKHI
ncbi:MAG: helix-turn-helix transcriptional regulator [Victivallales bacterium]